MSVSLPRHERQWTGLLIAMALLAGVITANRAYFQRVEAHFDFMVFWAAGRALARGHSPYNAGVMAAFQAAAGYDRDFFSPFYYPLWTGLLFVPLGLLPLPWAAALWQTLNQVMLLAALGAIAVGLRWRPSLPVLGLTVLSSLVFHPTLVAFVNGQLSILVLFLLSIVYCLLEVGRGNVAWLTAGGLLALTVVKPQLVLVILPLLLIWLVVQRRWIGLVGFAVILTIMVGASWIMIPGWVVGWLQDRGPQMMSSRIVPSVWGLAHDLAPRMWWVLGGVASTASLFWLVALWWSHRHGARLGLLLAMAVIAGQFIAPFLWVYDQAVLLFPFVVGMARLGMRRGQVAWRAALCVWAIVLPYLLYALANLRNRATANALLPVALLGIVMSLSWGTLYPWRSG